MIRFLLALLLLALPTVVAAQPTIPATPTSVNVYVLNATDPIDGTAIAPARNTSIGASASHCNQPMPAASPTALTNPSALAVTDPFNAGKACVVQLPASLPTGQNRKAVFTYVAPTCVVNGQSVSPCEGSRTTAAPFFSTVPILGPPAVAGVGVVVP